MLLVSYWVIFFLCLSIFTPLWLSPIPRRKGRPLDRRKWADTPFCLCSTLQFAKRDHVLRQSLPQAHGVLSEIFVL